MYERFTDRARKVMQLANQEAQRFNHEYIGTEHILLGLVKEGSGVAANVLKNLDVDLAEDPPRGREDRPARARAETGRHGPAAADPAGQEGDRVRDRGGAATSTTTTSAPNTCCSACSARKKDVAARC